MKIFDDVRSGLRQLVRQPGFALVAVLTLALGIGATTAIFTVVDGVLLSPLPFPRADRLVALDEVKPGGETGSLSAPDFRDYAGEVRSLASLAAYVSTNPTLSGGGDPERLSGATVTASFFPTLGVDAARGRTFLPAEDHPGVGRVAILSHALWARRFGGDPALVGRTVRLDGLPATVVGIMPPSFDFPAGTEVWLPIAFTAEQLGPDWRDAHYLQVAGRLAPGVSLAAARAELDAAWRRLVGTFPQKATRSPRLRPLDESLVGDVRPALVVLLAAVGCLLLVACVNVAGLLLTRAVSRRREVAVRVALGAGRGRLVRQLLTESALLGLLGGGAGLLLAVWGVDLLLKLAPVDLPRAGEVRVGAVAVAFALVLAVATGLLLGLAPAFQTTSPRLFGTLREGAGRGGEGRERHRLRGGLVVAQLALALVLATAAGLLLRSFLGLQRVATGFEPRGVLTLEIELPESRYPENSSWSAFYDRVIAGLERLPGVRSAAVTAVLPLGSHSMTLSAAPADPAARERVGGSTGSLGVFWRAVSPGYFRTLGIPLLAGRDLSPRDRAGAPPVAVVNRSMARLLWPGESALGKRVTIGYNDLDCEVVGVVGDVRHLGLDTEPGAEMYTSQEQTPWQRMAVVVKTAGEPLALVSAARAVVRGVDREQTVHSIAPMGEVVAASMARPRFQTLLVAFFGTVALGLAALGLYGLMTQAVVQRLHEVGVRMALGARPWDVLRLVVGRGLALAAVGVALGLAGALAAGRLLAGLLFAVSASDPPTLAAVALVLLAVALVASYLPARRAARVDPVEALRQG